MMTGPALMEEMGLYLAAMSVGDPSGLRFAPNFRLTENGRALGMGEGLWGCKPRFSGIQSFADALTGQIVCVGVAYVADQPRPFAQRLRIVEGELAEAEAIISTDSKGHFADVEQLLKPDILYQAMVPSHRRVDRDGLREVADRYWEGLEQSDGLIPRFNYRCDKYDNGAKTTNTLRTLLSADGKVHSCASALNDTRAARPKARERRFPVLDVELGVAASFVVVDFHPIPAHPRPDVGAMYMLGLFKVVDGEIRIIDEIREFLPLGTSAGWGNHRP
ncbi:hypothetical protein [Paraburkholderia phenoliruptrix]|uniref:hypothetical protein n=2 Tax=Paraburkholderia phenoliruptrix TaxID=252970 RepID=UPI0001C028DF|nr:hypothetical protein [Paraburkholderia phenoliruptrix]WMY11873.1 hypothetical protein P3F88_20935 [Paraburkholderia phenoliruptrix]